MQRSLARSVGARTRFECRELRPGRAVRSGKAVARVPSGHGLGHLVQVWTCLRHVLEPGRADWAEAVDAPNGLEELQDTASPAAMDRIRDAPVPAGRLGARQPASSFRAPSGWTALTAARPATLKLAAESLTKGHCSCPIAGAQARRPKVNSTTCDDEGHVASTDVADHPGGA